MLYEVITKPIIINKMIGERQPCLLEEPLPANSLRPVTQALIFLGIFNIGIEDLFDCVYCLGPTGRFIGQERNHKLGELGLRNPV